MYNEQQLISQLMRGDEKAFTLLFRKYYADLVLFAGTFLPDKITCEDIVQNVFVNVWAKREQLDIKTSFKSFLLRSVSNGCLDEIRHKKVVYEHEAASLLIGDLYNMDTENYVLHSELNNLIDNALTKLPENYKETFELSRIQGIKYRDIAQKLDVSERTVQERIAKTLNLLRKYLKDFLPLILFYIFYRN